MILNPIQWPQLHGELKVVTIWPHTLLIIGHVLPFNMAQSGALQNSMVNTPLQSLHQQVVTPNK